MSKFFSNKPNPQVPPTDYVFGSLVLLITLPYHRFFLYNTLKPALEIEEHASRGIPRHTVDREKLHSLLLGWRARKKDELGFVSIAGITVTAIVTASFSWPNVQDSYWVASGFWYASLMTSVCGILIAAQQMSLLTLMGELPEDPHAPSTKKMERHLSQILTLGLSRPTTARGAEEDAPARTFEWQLSWKLVFTWQCPMMFIGYSTLFYFIGLTVVVCSPLINGDPWGPSIWVATTYLIASGTSWGIFAYCSLGGYRSISLHEEDDCDELPANETVTVPATQEGRKSG